MENNYTAEIIRFKSAFTSAVNSKPRRKDGPLYQWPSHPGYFLKEFCEFIAPLKAFSDLDPFDDLYRYGAHPSLTSGAYHYLYDFHSEKASDGYWGSHYDARSSSFNFRTRLKSNSSLLGSYDRFELFLAIVSGSLRLFYSHYDRYAFIFEPLDRFRKEQAIWEGVLDAEFQKRVAAGLASERQLRLIQMVLESCMEDVKVYVEAVRLALFNTPVAIDEESGHYSYCAPVLYRDAVIALEAAEKQKTKLVSFFVGLRTESVEAGIWNHLQE
ncbi:hypothetical protein BJ508DRAFT_357282 [Ascobolus immersus RN42]|uniref:Uncharacterized protein n=1 Tax=Ascobolus immersus RN42 TaxID=1160509 RepID=A0A3N4IND8_ASCIM|nr:hypothetical protein BJ508DRAFT_357282 [Ascobolus immersus RN42]